MSEPTVRQRRVAERIRAYLAAALVREVGDPRLAGVVVTAVEVTADLGMARVSVRLLVDEEDDRARRTMLRGLERASGKLRRGLGPELGLRRVPELAFSYDEGQDAARRVEALLSEIEKERQNRS